MISIPIEEYQKYHQIGSHCASTTLRNVYSYFGMEMSEDLVFGLGAGLGFSYYKLSEMDLYSFSGRSRNFENNFTNFTQLPLIMHYNEAEDQIISNWTRSLNDKTPIILHLDMNSLNYLKNKFQLPSNLSFSEHLALLTGLDGDNAVISEYYQKKTIIVPLSEVLISISKTFEKKALKNIYYISDINKPMLPVQIALKHAIYFNAHNMLYGFGASLGIAGMKRFFYDLVKWPQTMDEQTLRANYRMIYFSFEQLGNGGGNFRRMYARFLKEAALIFKNKILEEIAESYVDLSVLWKDFSKSTGELSQKENLKSYNYGELYEGIIQGIISKENTAIESLYQWSLSQYK